MLSTFGFPLYCRSIDLLFIALYPTNRDSLLTYYSSLTSVVTLLIKGMPFARTSMVPVILL